MDYEIANYIALQLGRVVLTTSITGSFFISLRRRATTRIFIVLLHLFMQTYKIVAILAILNEKFIGRNQHYSGAIETARPLMHALIEKLR
jgi:hypothetical protein